MNYIDYVNFNEVDEETQERMKKLFNLPRKKYWRKKRIFDIIVALLSLMLLFPFLIIVYIVIFIDDPKGNPVFTQTRIGRRNKPFKFYKFRTMIKNAEEQLEDLKNKNEMINGPTFKIKNDPRITRVGKLLRTTGIDELPQLWNVLKGDMSMVGPRPPLPSEVETYNEYQKLRLAVTPGITCYWQTAKQRNAIPFTEWVEMDLHYIEHRNFLIDLKLIFKTAISMIKREGC